MRIPVFSGPYLIEFANPLRAEILAKAENARVTRCKRGKLKGQIICIDLRQMSDDSNMAIHRGNPRRYSHDRETKTNPARVWTLRHLPNQTKSIYRAVLTSISK
jgi:hypothetical protein